ncbi:hypothetical protein BKA64DRAFT_720959, partial [Cadophora sp. MPI-SDFR-AT-0126]
MRTSMSPIWFDTCPAISPVFLVDYLDQCPAFHNITQSASPIIFENMVAPIINLPTRCPLDYRHFTVVWNHYDPLPYPAQLLVVVLFAAAPLYFKIYDSFAVYFGIHLCWAGTILVFLYYYLSEINWEVLYHCLAFWDRFEDDMKIPSMILSGCMTFTGIVLHMFINYLER